MPTLFRRDEVVVDSMGNPISGVKIGLATQPANTEQFPPSPPVQLYSGPSSTDAIFAPPETDGNGMASYYVAQPGVYTVCYYSTQITGQQIVLVDQVISAPYNGQIFNNDSSALGTITGSINSVNTSFELSAAPTPPASLILMLNGIVQLRYSFSGTSIGLETPPNPGDVITASYIAPL